MFSELFLLAFGLMAGTAAVAAAVWLYLRMSREDLPPPDQDEGDGGVPPGDSLPRTDLPPSRGIDVRLSDEWRESVS